MNRRALLAAGAVLPFAGAVRAEAPSAGRLVTHAGFGSAHVQARNVSVWLPPGYDASDARHPVLYMHDGQNLFDPALVFNGTDWDIDGAMTRLVAFPVKWTVQKENFPARGIRDRRSAAGSRATRAGVRRCSVATTPP